MCVVIHSCVEVSFRGSWNLWWC